MKILKRLLLLALLVLVVGFAAAWIFLDPLVAKAIEKGATYAAGVETKVGSVHASPISGKFGIQELTLANPTGFRPEPFVHLGSMQAAWQNGSILSKTIEMDEFVVQDVEVNLERTGAGTNYGKILDNLSKVTGGDKPSPDKDKKAPEAKGEKSLLIKKIEIRNVRAGLHLSGLADIPVTVPSIVLENFRSDGSTTEIVAKLTRVLVQAILENVLSAGKDIFPADIVKDLGKGLSGIGGTLGSGAKSAIEGVQGALKGAGDLFKKK